MDKSLSVIFTVYNKEKYVERSINCLYDALSFLETPYEVIIVEDHSTDSSLDIIKPFASRPHTTLLINEENKGHFQTKCRGYLAAKHTWIMTIDGDDYIDKEYIKELVDALEETTHLMIARNNKVLTAEITDNTNYWSIHNLPFMIFRREFIIKHKDYYSAPIPKSAWDDCIIVVPMYCQVNEMLENGNPKALKHYKNTHRYRVNYTHPDEEIKGIAKLTLTNGVRLMKHLSDWTVKTGYFERYYKFLVPVFTQYVGVFMVDSRFMHPFVKEVNPRKDDSFVVIFENTELSKDFKDHRQTICQYTLPVDLYFTSSFTDALKALEMSNMLNNRPVIRLSGDCNVTPLFYDEILAIRKQLEENNFDVAGCTYIHKGVKFIDYSRPVIYGAKFVKVMMQLTPPLVIQEAIRLRNNAKTISINEVLDKVSFSRSNLNYSHTYIPKVIRKLNKQADHLISLILRGTNNKEIPMFYIKDLTKTDAENETRLNEFKELTKKEILPISMDALKMAAKSEKESEQYWMLFTYNMPSYNYVKLIGALWQITVDKVDFDIIAHIPCLIKTPNRLKIYAMLNDAVNVIDNGGIVKVRAMEKDLSNISGVVYQAI